MSDKNGKIIYYSEYGAVGDGITNDFEAIIRAHNAANEADLKVCADAGSAYYIGASTQTALIQTDTDWGDAKFIIDDSKVTVENRNSPIFNISSKLSPESITTVKTLCKNQEKLDLSLQYDSFVTVIDKNTMRYIREGLNQDNGSPQTDVFSVDKTGNVDAKTPIIWDYDNITSMMAYPVETETLIVKGGHFTTVANQAESKYTYYARNIKITRSNIIIDGLYHAITGELDHGAPYGGFINIYNCADITVQNCMLSGHKTYMTIGSANAPVPMGSYDISVNKSSNVTFKNCKQINDIHDTTIWGIFGSNYSKNIMFDTVEFSRFDAHMGVANATIKDSVLGYMGVHLIGCGVFIIENTKVCGYNFISLRGDYGSTWNGDIIIRNCEFVPRNGAKSDAVLIGGRYSGKHDFGYTCYMPKKITIDGLIIDDTNTIDGYPGPKLLGDFNPSYTSGDYTEKYPYVITEEINITDMTVKSGKKYLVSDNSFMFRNVKVHENTKK